MKKLGIIFILMLSLISCSKDDTKTPAATDYYGKWTLVKMTTFRTANTIFDKLEWQESYVFNTNGTFVKTRIADNKTITASGTFKTTKSDKGTSFELTYKENSPIIGTCFGNLTESLSINQEGLLVSFWQACDGPGLVYQKAR